LTSALVGSEWSASRPCLSDPGREPRYPFYRRFGGPQSRSGRYGNVRERLAVSKQTAHDVHIERFNQKKLNEVEGKEQCCVEISNRFSALEVDVNRAWETIRKNIKYLPKRV
jgi:hypothetical protein